MGKGITVIYCIFMCNKTNNPGSNTNQNHRQTPFRILLWIKYNVLVGTNQNFLFFCGVGRERLQLLTTLYCRKSESKPEIDLHLSWGIKKYFVKCIHKCLYFKEGAYLERKMIFHVMVTVICLSFWLGCFPSWLLLVAVCSVLACWFWSVILGVYWCHQQVYV